MKAIVTLLIVFMAIIGVTTACVNFGQSLSYGFSATTTGASYSEGGTFNLGSEDSLRLGSVFAFDNEANMFSQTTIDVNDNGVDNAQVSVYQDMYYTKSIVNYVDPHMSNRVYMYNGDMDVTMFMGSKMDSVQMGMDAMMKGTKGSYFDFYGYTTDDHFTPIASGFLRGSNFDGIVEAKDKFTFDRTTQLNSAVFGFNSTL